MAADLDNKKSGSGAAIAAALARSREARPVPRTRNQKRAEDIQVANAQCTYSPENPSGRQILIVSMFIDINSWISGFFFEKKKTY